MGEYVREIGAREWHGEVAESKVPVLVDFWAEWCAPCHKLSPVLEEIAAERTGQLKVLKLDMEANPEVVMQREIRSAPTLVLFSGGAELERVVGFLPKRRLETRLDEALAATR